MDHSQGWNGHHNSNHYNGYSNGIDNGHSNGYQNGYDNGIDNGYSNGYQNGYDNSHDATHTNGYSNGHSNGMSNGNTSASNTNLDHIATREFEHFSEKPYGYGTGPSIQSTSESIEVLCGPLINYQRMSEEDGGVFWHGTVLIVTKPGQRTPHLRLRSLGPANKQQQQQQHQQSSGTGSRPQDVEGLKLYADPTKEFWRFTVRLPLSEAESVWQYTIPRVKFLSDVHPEPVREFYVPAATESMRIMFHSCNGFSVGTDEDFWSGPALWNDVLRKHREKPFHVMIGGGDQIYNDGVRVNGPLKDWTAITNPHKRRAYPFGETLRAACDKYYFENYVRWYSHEPFATANAAIPQINIWDDHDIIDGFGSYTDHFMKCAVFRGIGGVSFKYYCLFQHHTAPPISTFTTDAPATMKASVDGTAGADERQTKDAYIYLRQADDPSWIVGNQPGPYVEERSRSLYMRLGARIAFCGIDARTERTRRQINYPETYNLIFNRLESELNAARGQIKHLILLLGVPIAYPRLAWLENIFTSPIIAPIRLLNKRFGLAGGLFNSFDGQIDLLDDLDDHYTAKHHKTERRELIVRLQKLAQQHSIRITILGGDVHLAAIGRFYSNPTNDVEAEHDPRYMANIISSAITNKPPPKAVANLLAKRNKIHHLRDGNTDETLMKIFDTQPGGVMKSSDSNNCTMPSRNYATITEIPDRDSVPGMQSNGVSGGLNPGDTGYQGKDRPDGGNTKKGKSPLHIGEENAGSQHPAADGVNNEGVLRGGLNVSLRVEIDNQNRDGNTMGYGFSIPKLTPQHSK